MEFISVGIIVVLVLVLSWMHREASKWKNKYDGIMDVYSQDLNDAYRDGVIDGRRIERENAERVK